MPVLKSSASSAERSKPAKDGEREKKKAESSLTALSLVRSLPHSRSQPPSPRGTPKAGREATLLPGCSEAMNSVAALNCLGENRAVAPLGWWRRQNSNTREKSSVGRVQEGMAGGGGRELRGMDSSS